MEDYIKLGIQKGLISFDENKEFIKYINYPKPKRYTCPEDKVQADTFLKLVLDYGYKPERILINPFHYHLWKIPKSHYENKMR